MKAIQSIGLLVFFVGFFLFNISLFTESYQLKNDSVEQFIPEGKRTFFNEAATELYSRSFSNNFEFLDKIGEAFERSNEEIIALYAISFEEIDQLVNLQEGTYQLNVLGKIFDETTDIGAFKIKSLKDYSSWLENSPIEDPIQFRDQLMQIAENINKWELVSKKGFDKYQIKTMSYEITKASSAGPVTESPLLFLVLSIGLAAVGGLAYIIPRGSHANASERNHGIFHRSLSSKGWLGIFLGVYLISFYLLLYFFHPYMTSWILMVDPISFWLKGSAAGQFFLYGFLYTLVILVMGVRMLIKYRNSKYQVFRTLSVMFFQTAFAFLIPEILLRLNQPYFDFKNIWPLDYDFFFDYELNTLVQSGNLGIFMLFWGLLLIIIGVPIFVYFFGKRWYCSWVCGCGGLAETMGDSFRQLSDKSVKAWKFERYSIHGVLVFAVLMTAAVLYTYFSGSSTVLGVNSYSIREVYGVYIGAWFAGVVGTGFYPLMGNRVWCRFGCPLAAYLGIVQRFKSRFRITTNGGQCISCGNCSTYCEMGIDVRWYAQRGQNIVRSSCVGCGVCSEVCPRGVLKLEVKEEKGRFGLPTLPGLQKSYHDEN